MNATLPITSDRKLQVEFGGYSTAGVKPSNEDAFAAQQPSGSARLLKGATACIADGASCSEQAQLASETAVTHFINDYYSTPDTWPVKTAAARVLSALNSWLYHHGKQSALPHNGLVTTFSAVIIKSTTAHIFHSGDSRIYRYRDNVLEPLTRDHNYYQRDGSAVLTRALGIDSHLEVDHFSEAVAIGDYLVLTTDGVHGALNNAELTVLLAEQEANLEQHAQAIVKAALAKGSADNASCLLVKVVDLPLEDIDEVHRQLTQLAIPPVLQEGQSIDGLKVLRVLHSGTRSHLYLVQESDTQKLFALKAPSENFSDDPQYLEGFIREQWVASRIQHAGVMTISPRPAQSPFLYLLCEYIEGQTLRQWIFDNPKPSLESVRQLTREIIGALRALQRLHMTHRDLKPENIMLTDNGRIKIIDFGTVHVGGLDEVASPLRESVPVGSADYIAPEYLLGETGSFVSDIFSLGAIVYEMLTGKLPYKLSLQRQRHLKGIQDYRYHSAREQRADLPLWVDLALQKATQPDVRLRYQALSEFMQDLCVPNQSMLNKRNAAPLLERNPLRFWQGVAVLLFVISIAQCALLLR
jgi:protein phosphatase